MSDVKNAYNQIAEFLNNETEKTLLLCGIADKEKHLSLLEALNAQGNLKGLIFLIHTTRDGMAQFFRWAGLYKVKVPSTYRQAMKFSNLTILFEKLSTRGNSSKYDYYKYNNIVFDFMIIWPIQSVLKNEEEIQLLKELAMRQKTKKIIFLTLKEPWYNPDPFKPIVDRIIKLDCENDNPHEFQRVLSNFNEEVRIRNQINNLQ